MSGTINVYNQLARGVMVYVNKESILTIGIIDLDTAEVVFETTNRLMSNYTQYKNFIYYFCHQEGVARMERLCLKTLQTKQMDKCI